MVKVKYGEPYRTSFGLSEEKIKAKTLGDLIGQVEKKYEGKTFANTLGQYALVFFNNKELLDIKNNLEYKLKPKDEVTLMMMLGGG